MKKPIGILKGPIIDDRIISDKTFAKRLLLHLESTQANGAAGSSELEYLTMVARKLFEYQVATCPEDELPYIKRVAKQTPITEQHLIDRGFEKEVIDHESRYLQFAFNDEKYCDLALVTGDKNGFLEVCLFPYENFFRFQYIEDVDRLIELLKK